jgi:hypothetical protein
VWTTKLGSHLSMISASCVKVCGPELFSTFF